MTPQTVQGAPFKKNSGTDTGAVMETEMLDIKNIPVCASGIRILVYFHFSVP
jgi:hypothetical protein